jgi:hypothetical protein
LSKNQLARLLKEFEIEPVTIRLADGSTAKGYYRQAFEDVWERYACPDGPSEPSRRNSAGMVRAEPDSRTVTDETHVTVRERDEAAPIAACDGVTVQTPLIEGGAAIPPGPLLNFLDDLHLGAEQ